MSVPKGLGHVELSRVEGRWESPMSTIERAQLQSGTYQFIDALPSVVETKTDATAKNAAVQAKISPRVIRP
jgi:hypothetical protein